MRKILLFAVLAFTLISCNNDQAKGTNGVVYKTAVQYNDYIVSRQTKLMKNIMDFVGAAQSNLDSAETLLDKYVTETGIMITDIKGMPPFKGDSTLRDAAAGIFGFYKRIFDKDYREILHIRKNEDGDNADSDAEIAQIVKRIEEEEKGFDDRFQGAQKSFAQKNKMKLIDNEMQKEFDEKMKAEE